MFGSKKPIWENSEQSTGSKCQMRMSGQNCYEAVGPVCEIFKEIGPRIRELLDEHKDELEYGEQKQRAVAFYIFMIGSEPAQAQPTVIFASKSRRQRKKAKALVEEKRLLTAYPAIGLKTLPDFPAIPLGTELEPSRASEKFSADEIRILGTPENLCGALIESHSGQATLGGVIEIQGVFYGTTVRHISLTIPPEAESPVGSLTELEFDDDDPEFDSEDDEASDTTKRGTGSSYLNNQFEVVSSSSQDYSNAVQGAFASGSSSTVTRPSMSVYQSLTNGIIRDRSSVEDVQSTVAGENPHYLDYQIFRIENPIPHFMNCIRLPEEQFDRSQTLSSTNIMPTASSKPIWMATAKGGPVRGRLVECPRFIKMPGWPTFEEVWVAILERKNMDGDCGAWILDAHSGDLYGHVIAGRPSSFEVYLLPAYKIFEDIASNLGQTPKLPLKIESPGQLDFDSTPRVVSSPSSMQDDESIYDLAIDLGTVFTTVAAVRVRAPSTSQSPHSEANPRLPLDEIFVINRYPGLSSSSNCLAIEVPTTLVYRRSKLVSWGVELDNYEGIQEEDQIHLGLFKLLLAETDIAETDRTTALKKRILAKCEMIGIGIVDVLTDFLRVIYQHAVQEITTLSSDRNKKTFKFTLCCPATWSPLAQQRMREAGMKAGMVLRENGLITEPEAVAAFLLEKEHDLDVEAGDLIVILDCGGGTCDVAGLVIESRKPLQMSQAAPINATGAILGSILLDETFEKHLRKRLAHVAYIPHEKMESGIRTAISEFKHALKPAFGTAYGLEVSVRFDGLSPDSENNFMQNRMIFTGAELQEIFDPIVQDNIGNVVTLIQNYTQIMKQESKPVKQAKYLFFVGGLSGSAYIESAFRKAFWEDPILGYPIQVKTPSIDGSTAVARGALLLASKHAHIMEIRLPHGYGTIIDEPFVPKIHGRGVTKYKDKYDKRLMVRDRIQVIVKKNQIIRGSYKVPYVVKSGVLYFDVEAGGPYEIELRLLQCESGVEDHADLRDTETAKGITLAYTMTFNLSRAIEAMTKTPIAGAMARILPVMQYNNTDNVTVPPHIWRNTSSQASKWALRSFTLSDTATVKTTEAPIHTIRQPVSKLEIHPGEDFEESDVDSIANSLDSIRSSTSTTNTAASFLDNIHSDTSLPNGAFYRFSYQIIVRIIGSELRFEVEAPPGGPVWQSTSLDISKESEFTG